MTGRVRVWFIASSVFALLAACVPSVRQRPTTEETRQPPAPPTVRRSAAAMAVNAPLTGPGAPAPPPKADERLVPAHWHWNGVEWQWIPERLEKKDAPFDWKRD